MNTAANADKLLTCVCFILKFTLVAYPMTKSEKNHFQISLYFKNY